MHIEQGHWGTQVPARQPFYLDVEAIQPLTMRDYNKQSEHGHRGQHTPVWRPHVELVHVNAVNDTQHSYSGMYIEQGHWGT